MKCIILAAGSMIKREAPKSGAWPKHPKPKTLYHVRGGVLLERQVRLLQEVGMNDIRVVLGYRKEMIEQLTEWMLEWVERLEKEKRRSSN